MFNSYLRPRYCYNCVNTMLREAWTLAIESLSWMQMRRLSEPLALAKTVKQLNVHDSDAVRFARSLISETVRRQNFIDAFIKQAIRPTSLDELNLGVQAFLRLYVYQTRIASNWSKIDLSQAENITRLARSILGWQTLQPIEPFLGTLLIQRPEPVVEHKDDIARVALQTFHPTWFVEYCFRLFGRKEALAILESDIAPPPLCVRLNTLRAGRDQILEKLREEGVEVAEVEPSAFTYKVVKAGKPVIETACFHEGLIHLQDRSDSVVAEAANPGRGVTVLDVCCAPGVITAQLGQMMDNDGLIVSVDYSRRRMAAWTKEIQRAGVKIAEPIIADAQTRLPIGLEADLVVLDPPCTGTGLFSRLPSFKWRLSPRSIDRMADIQWQMLDNCVSRVKPGGVLIYSTSSITVEENELLIEKFLKWHPEFSLAEIPRKTGLPGLRGLDRCERLYPHIHNCNGLFVAKMVKGSN
jgi:16S rRNA (cytosine967-C5)-methyltransferase